jgi:hypothetical protein
MSLKRVGLTAVLALGLTPVVCAGQHVDVDRLPVDRARIQRELKQSAERDDSTGLHIQYVIDVYGRAPRIEFFTKEDNLQTGPVPYGGPTHQEMLRVMTPQEFRAPAADLSVLLRWLAEQAKKK